MPPTRAGAPRVVAPAPWRRWTRDVGRLLRSAPDLTVSLVALMGVSAVVLGGALWRLAQIHHLGGATPRWDVRVHHATLWSMVWLLWMLLDRGMEHLTHQFAAFISGHLPDTPRTVGPSAWARHAILLRAVPNAWNGSVRGFLGLLTVAMLVGAAVSLFDIGASLLRPTRTWFGFISSAWILWLVTTWAQQRALPIAPVRSRLAAALAREGCPVTFTRILVAVGIEVNPHAFRWLPTIERVLGSAQMAWIIGWSLLDTILGPIFTLYTYVIMRDVFYHDDALEPVTETVIETMTAPSPALVPVPA